MASRSRSRVLTISLTVVLAVIAGIGAHFIYRTVTHKASGCTIGGYELDTDQASVAATMVGAVTSFRPPLAHRAAVLVLAAGLQESKLRNLVGGDRDSVGVLQQRPSQGWGGGDPAVLHDVFKATTEFLQHLVEDVPDWLSLPMADAIQHVQISADGSAYAKHETEATALANSLIGDKPNDVTCHFDKPTQVASATTVAHRLAGELPVKAPTTSGRVITVSGAKWQTVGWLVAYADRLGIDEVSYASRTWTRAHGWKDSDASASAVVATMALISN